MNAGDICPDCEIIGLPGALCPKHAAVDDLLAACKAALDPDPCRLDRCGFCQAHTLAAPCEQKLFREAIAKAEGQ